MKPRSAASADSGDLFRAELATILNPKHELILLADRIDWSQMDPRGAATGGRPLGSELQTPLMCDQFAATIGFDGPPAPHRIRARPAPRHQPRRQPPSDRLG